MYSITAEVINVFRVPATDKYEESFKVQLMGDRHLKDGEIRKEMVTLSVPRPVYSDLKDKVGVDVTLPVAFFAQGGVINAFYPKDVSA